MEQICYIKRQVSHFTHVRYLKVMERCQRGSPVIHALVQWSKWNAALSHRSNFSTKRLPVSQQNCPWIKMNPIWEAKHFNLHHILGLYCEVEAAWKERQCSWERHLAATPEHAENLAHTAAHKRFWFALSLLSIDKLFSIAPLLLSVSLTYMERRPIYPRQGRDLATQYCGDQVLDR